LYFGGALSRVSSVRLKDPDRKSGWGRCFSLRSVSTVAQNLGCSLFLTGA
jgi:hypothetical protein